MITTRRQWLQAATMLPACLALRAAQKQFWESKDPASWSNDEKQVLLSQSPWAQEGFVRMEVEKNRRTTPGYGNNGRPGVDMPDTRPGVPPGGVRSVPIGEAPPPVPNPDPGHPVQFRVLARWESAKASWHSERDGPYVADGIATEQRPVQRFRRFLAA